MNKMTATAIPALLMALFACHSSDLSDRSAEASRQAHSDNFSYRGGPQEQVSVGGHEYRNPILSGYYPAPSIMPLRPSKPADHNPILTQRDLDTEREYPIIAAGHAKFVQIPDGDWWATFLAIRPYEDNLYNIGRETFLLPVTRKNDWPYILPQGEFIPTAHKKPDLPEQPAPDQPTSGDFAYKADFNQQALGRQWIGIRNPIEPFFQVADGTLRLSCNGSFTDLEVAPSFIGRRQQHHTLNFGTRLSFDPIQDGDRAGLAAVQNDESLIFFGIERIDGVGNLVAHKKGGAKPGQLINSEPVASTDEVRLTMEMNVEA